MKRILTQERSDKLKRLKDILFEFHTMGDTYWDESAFYQFNMRQIEEIEKASNDLFDMCLVAVQHVIDKNLFDKLQIDPKLIPLIIQSWEDEHPSVYGRFDFGYDGIHPPKMLEFNADTPTSLYESSVVQWQWLQDKFKDKDQFNSIHEKLIGYWAACKDYFADETVYFSSIDEIEEFTTTEYLRDTASQGGLSTKFIDIHNIGWDDEIHEFVDEDGEKIFNIFKLYPWENLIDEDFGVNIIKEREHTIWFEPAWKAVLSNKGIIPILWELYPGHENLLSSYFDDNNKMKDYVKKPIYSREGANVTIYKDGVETLSTPGEYGDEGFIFQEFYKLPCFDGNYPIIGSWIIGGESAGIGIRECKTLITDNMSRFLPHLIN